MIFERHQSSVSSFRPHALESTCVVTKRTQLVISEYTPVNLLPDVLKALLCK